MSSIVSGVILGAWAEGFRDIGLWTLLLLAILAALHKTKRLHNAGPGLTNAKGVSGWAGCAVFSVSASQKKQLGCILQTFQILTSSKFTAFKGSKRKPAEFIQPTF